ncbi:hypothetical protein H0H81_010395 [Sphagnurus paluster]|uniref:Uncharacterized protein n=1 Tax=Sphagnurus paluster TaxID=117069 RepID=A0A9P7FV64_9AGAR|nr:hypothetical protein H0H81_010395 [Sphagnurus paluster]
MPEPLRQYKSSLFHALFVLSVVMSANAQAKFTWQFAQDASKGLPQCTTIPITVDNPSASSTNATYYMIALAINGTPTTSLAGTAANLAWKVDQPIGAQILLYLFDSTGGSGGVPSAPSTVIAGQSSSCLPSISNSFTITANTTEEIATCDTWQLVMRGGTPPFNVLLASPGASAVTNVTLDNGEDLYRYINRAAPMGTLLGAASDSRGLWANGSPYVHTTGSSNTTCGMQTSSGGIAPFTTPPTTPSNPSSIKKNDRAPTIAGICVAIVGLIFIGVTFVWFLRRRKHKQKEEQKSLEPHPFRETRNTLFAGAALPTMGPDRPSKFQTNLNFESASTSTSQPITATSPSPNSNEPYGSALPSAPVGTPGATTPVLVQSTKATETRVNVPMRGPSIPSENSRWPPGLDRIFSDTGEVVFQHTDARAVGVREIPPPYGTQRTDTDVA